MKPGDLHKRRRPTVFDRPRTTALILALSVTATLAGIAVKRNQPPPLSVYYPKSTAIYAARGELMRLTLAADGQFRLWTPLREIPDAARTAALLYEDRWFYRHPGINLWALIRAAWSTITTGSRQGGSTISMQVARQLYLINSRSFRGKLAQIGQALLLEARYTKDELLEAYLNSVPYGGNISGIGTASRIYFHKPAADLSRVEALSLAVIPQNPARRAPIINQAPHALLAARERIWRIWLENFPEDRRFAEDFALPLTFFTRKELPFFAPHFTDSLLRRCAGSKVLHSSLSLNTQRSLERAIQLFLTTHRDKKIHNAAAMLVDTNDMTIRALVGSANYFDAALHGQVDGTSAKRSPGSTLKPFIYALALDQGLLHPRTILGDLPTAFGTYSPENFDGRFVGPLPAEDALIRSRNIPAVSVAAQLARPTLYQFLLQAGISQLRREQHYGLALALGGGEVTMEELIELYALLANRGSLQHISYCGHESPIKPLSLLSPAAAFITLEMLKRNPRPDSKRPDQPATAWKTGTSWGFRDAWSIGVAGHYVLAVWVGNFDGSKNPSLIGSKAAAPLFYSILDSLRSEHLLPGLDDPVPNFKPDSVSQIEVCAASGDLPNADCPVRLPAWYIPGKSPIKISDLHRKIFRDPKSGGIVCPDTPNSRQEIAEFWSSEMLRQFSEAGMPRQAPPLLPECYHAKADSAPHILSPAAAAYTLRLSKPAPITLLANAAAGETVFWFADRSFIGKTKASEAYAWLPSRAGQFKIIAVDPKGQSASTAINVEFVP